MLANCWGMGKEGKFYGQSIRLSQPFSSDSFRSQCLIKKDTERGETGVAG
jgi:hypothetical protein